jgi:hypothetical protein
VSRVSELDFSHPLYLYDGAGGGVVEVRTAAPIPADGGFTTWAQVESPRTPDAAQLLVHATVAAAAALDGRWWGQAWVWAVPPGTAAEPLATDAPGARLLGEFQLARERPDLPVASADWAAVPAPAATHELSAVAGDRRIAVELSEEPSTGLPRVTAPEGWPPGWDDGRAYLLHPFDELHPDPAAAPVEVELFRAFGDPEALAERILAGAAKPLHTIRLGPADSTRWKA